ncbi:MAG: hypothetical protein VW147_03635 [Bacteroidota bacterium]|jgi:hypothetical protein
MGITKSYSILGFVITLILSFVIASNIESYRHPESINFLRESLLESLEFQKENSNNPTLDDTFDKFIFDLEYNLNERMYKKLSLVRMIGCIVALFGSVFLRQRKKLGLHLFLGGNIFVIMGSFYFLGLGLSGWVINFSYLFFATLSTLYFFRKRAYLI